MREKDGNIVTYVSYRERSNEILEWMIKEKTITKLFVLLDGSKEKLRVVCFLIQLRKYVYLSYE